ncbi:MAG: long-chain fatty acid--CoA ligase [Rhodobacteraceae bacterium]|nr:long-chain fatty acid--CoA ligase [Paracoccaceae bacterium]
MLGMMMDAPLLLSGLIDYAADSHAKREVVSRELDGHVARETYAEARDRARKLAQGLDALGLREGERLGVLAWNTRAYFEMFYAVPGMGAVLHTINPRLYEDQLVYIINHAEDAWFAFDAGCIDLVRAVAPQLTTVRGWIFMGPREELPDDLNLARVEFYEEILDAQPGGGEWPEFDENRAAMICYTSGTTGNPKGVVYSHRSIVLSVVFMMLGDTISGFRSGVTETFMPFAPLFHGGGWFGPYSAPLMGANLVLPGRDFTAPALYDLLEDEGVTLCFGVPTIWMIVVNWMKDHGKTFSTLRATVMSGAKPPRALQAALFDLGVEPMQGWGMTETLGSSRMALIGGMADLSREEKLDRYQFGGRRTFATKYRLEDDDGNPVPFDGVSRGHLLVRGPVVAGGYLKLGEDPEGKRPGEMHDWLHTGDIAILHPDGQIEIADRSKDVIKSGGEWISSVELENAAMGHPEIAEAAVIAIAHPKWQERPLLVCARRAGATVTGAEVIEFLRGQVADWWLPDAVEFLDELPRTGTGKIWKLKIRDAFEGYELPLTAAGGTAPA